MKNYFKLMKLIYSKKSTINFYVVFALMGYILTSIINKSLVSLLYLFYYFIFTSFVSINIFLVNRWRNKQNKKKLNLALKSENYHKIKFYNHEGYLGQIDSDKYAIALYQVNSNDFLLFKQLLNFPVVLFKIFLMGLYYVPIGFVGTAIALSYYDDQILSSITLGQVLSSKFVFVILNINIIIISIKAGWQNRFPGYVRYRSKALTSLLSEYLPVLSTTNGWYCKSENEVGVYNDLTPVNSQ